MGTPDFAVTTLKALVENGHKVVGVITAPDKPAGRGRKIRESAVKLYAKEQNLPILQPLRLKDPTFLNQLKELKANLQIVVAFRMLPEVVWKMPDLGTFNLHASLLPDYRGAAPINWAIINGEKETGVTTFFINENIDTGAILLQEKVEITEEDNAGSLHDSLMQLGADLVLKTVKQIAEGEAEAIPQPSLGTTKEAPKLNKDNCRIRWEDTAENIYNHIRGLSPYPSAWTSLRNGDKELDLKIFQAKYERTVHKEEYGTVLSNKKEWKVAAKGGLIHLLEVQLSGKKRMPVSALLNGFL